MTLQWHEGIGQVTNPKGYLTAFIPLGEIRAGSATDLWSRRSVSP